MSSTLLDEKYPIILEENQKVNICDLETEAISRIVQILIKLDQEQCLRILNYAFNRFTAKNNTALYEQLKARLK